MGEPRFLIDPNVIVHRGSISEDQLRARMAAEAIEQAGWTAPDGKPLKGVSWRITRGDGRSGGYKIEVTRDLRVSDQARIEGPDRPSPLVHSLG